ncbi:YheC/YheD family protein [Paenibacillus sp. OV219]|uniref:YheC/YheD family protein n=1 Tax=Paenibacillus sp. OV219 TaxID=1884377 RepID=UPI0015A6F8EB|nr:YheC/YheD family protein [Paenibacillus sp. OV219]
MKYHLQATEPTAAANEAEEQLGLLGELSVDLVFDMQDKLWIIEINGKPHKSIYNDIPGVAFSTRIFQRPLEYAGYLAQAISEEPPNTQAEETTLLHAACDSIGIETSTSDLLRLLSPKK